MNGVKAIIIIIIWFIWLQIVKLPLYLSKPCTMKT
jgi:hypothetical protein